MAGGLILLIKEISYCRGEYQLLEERTQKEKQRCIPS